MSDKKVYIVRTENDGNVAVVGNAKKAFEKLQNLFATENLAYHSTTKNEARRLTYPFFQKNLKTDGFFNEEIVNSDGERCSINIELHHFNRV